MKMGNWKNILKEIYSDFNVVLGIDELRDDICWSKIKLILAYNCLALLTLEKNPSFWKTEFIVEKAVAKANLQNTLMLFFVRFIFFISPSTQLW